MNQASLKKLNKLLLDYIEQGWPSPLSKNAAKLVSFEIRDLLEQIEMTEGADFQEEIAIRALYQE